MSFFLPHYFIPVDLIFLSLLFDSLQHTRTHPDPCAPWRGLVSVLCGAVCTLGKVKASRHWDGMCRQETGTTFFVSVPLFSLVYSSHSFFFVSPSSFLLPSFRFLSSSFIGTHLPSLTFARFHLSFSPLNLTDPPISTPHFEQRKNPSEHNMSRSTLGQPSGSSPRMFCFEVLPTEVDGWLGMHAFGLDYKLSVHGLAC